jgi:GAF domain-containing protein
MAREALVAHTFVELADSLTDDFDVVDLLTLLTDRCVNVLDVAAAGLMLAAPSGELRVLASSSEVIRLVELFELQTEEGPCLDCYRTGEPVSQPDLRGAHGRWPRFAPVAGDAGFRSVHALPMRLRDTVIGALNLFRTTSDVLEEADLVVGRAMADVATIAILHHRAVTEAQVLTEQLNLALNSRIVIEQAKGMLAERATIGVDEAFEGLRAYARRHGIRLVTVAESVIDGSLSPTAVIRRPG